MGVATGCCCKQSYRFPHTTYPYSPCICSILQQHPYFLFIFLMFFVLVPALVIKLYVLIFFPHSINCRAPLKSHTACKVLTLYLQLTFHPLSTIVIHALNFAHTQVQSIDDNCGEWVECMGVASGCG